MSDDRGYPWPPYEDDRPQALPMKEPKPPADPPLFIKIYLGAMGALLGGILVVFLLGAFKWAWEWSFG